MAASDLGEVQRAERLVDAAIQRERRGRGAGLARHLGGGVAEFRVRMHLLHEPREIVCGIDLFEGRVKWPQRVFDGARARDRQDPINVLLRFRQASGLELFEGGHIGFGRPQGRLRLGHLLRAGCGGQKNGNPGKAKGGHGDSRDQPSIYRAGRLSRVAGYAE